MITLIDTGYNMTDVDSCDADVYFDRFEPLITDGFTIKDVSIYVPVRGASPSRETPTAPAPEPEQEPLVWWEEDDTTIEDTLSLNFIQVNEI